MYMCTMHAPYSQLLRVIVLRLATVLTAQQFRVRMQWASAPRPDLQCTFTLPTLVLSRYSLRFSLQVLRVYLGYQFYHPNINCITQKL